MFWPHIHIAFVFLTMCSLSLAAQAPSLSQQTLRQEQLRTATERLAGHLSELVHEFERNGLAGEDLQRLKVIRGVLSSVSGEDMATILRALQDAQSLTASNSSSTVQAYTRQKTASTKLRAVVAEYLQLAESYELARQLRELASRQTDLMWRTAWLVIEGGGDKNLSERQSNELRLLQIDQAALASEFLLVSAKLRGLKTVEVAGVPEAEDAFKKLDASLEKESLFRATGDQRAARNSVRDLARALMLSHGELPLLKEAVHALDEIEESQRVLMQAPGNEDSVYAMRRQGQIVDLTDLVQRDIELIVPRASESLDDAIEAMNQSRDVMEEEKDARKRQAKVNAPQTRALEAIEFARQALNERLARGETNSSGPESAALDELSKLITEQEDLKKLTASFNARKKELMAQASAQGELLDRVRAVQAEMAGEAAISLGVAATQMEQAQLSLAAGKNNEIAQAAAIDALKRAREQLAQQMSDAQLAENADKAEEGLSEDELSEASNQLGEAQQDIEKALAQFQIAAKRLATPAAALQRAGSLLSKAGKQINPVASSKTSIPSPVRAAAQRAKSSAEAGAAEAAAGRAESAERDALAAAEALGEAQAALAVAKAGMKSSMAASGQQGQGQSPGEGESPGQGAQQGNPGEKGDGTTGNWAATPGGDGQRRNVQGSGRFTRLPDRDRAALLQSRGESYPKEYAPLVEQYLKNLADQSPP